MKKALVCGAGGFIGSHLVKKLKKDNYWIRGVDLKYPEFDDTSADEFFISDLRNPENCERAVLDEGKAINEVYQLAADMGGMGFIESAECEILKNNSLINIHMIDSCAKNGVKHYFYSSSACIYRDMNPDDPELSEVDAYPAQPDNEYGWEKLYAERIAMAFSRKFGMKVRIARFQNTYGPEGTWRGGREKAPAALCRKIAEIDEGGTIEVWGDGSASRSYTYIDDLIEGILLLMHSELEGGVNIGRKENVSVDELVHTIAEVAGKKIAIKYIHGPVGVKARNFTNARIKSIGWNSKFSLMEGISQTYPWIENQVER